MNRALLPGVCVTIILTSLLSGCFDPGDGENNRYYYSIKILAQQPFNFTIYAPIAYELGSDYSTEKIASYLRVTHGTGQFEIIWTEHGSALKIESNNTIYLVSEFQDTDEYHPLGLSMRSNIRSNDTKEHWVFSNSTEQGELEVSITLRAEAGECCGEVRTEQTEPEFQTVTGDGWQKIIILYTVLE